MGCMQIGEDHKVKQLVFLKVVDLADKSLHCKGHLLVDANKPLDLRVIQEKCGIDAPAASIHCFVEFTTSFLI
jgi:hypothetical protein